MAQHHTRRQADLLQVQQSTGEVPGPVQPRALLPQMLGVSSTASVSQPQRGGEGRTLRTTGGPGWARGAGAHLQRAVPLQRRGEEVIDRQPTARDGFEGGLPGALGGVGHSQEPRPRPGGKYAVIIVTPPCGTWSRVTWANHFGPKPIRDETRPWGHPWLSEKLRKRADEGNIMIVLFIDILMLLGTTWCNLIARQPYFLGEHPEDLGGLHSPVAQGKWVRPASIWKLPDLRNAADKLEGMQSIALHQCNWGAPTPKPTRLLTDLPLHASFLFNQWPREGTWARCHGIAVTPTSTVWLSSTQRRPSGLRQRQPTLQIWMRPWQRQSIKCC